MTDEFWIIHGDCPSCGNKGVCLGDSNDPLRLCGWCRGEIEGLTTATRTPNVELGNLIHDIMEMQAKFAERSVASQYLLCGEAVYKRLMKIAHKAVEDASAGPRPVSTLNGLRVVMSRMVPPDFWQVLPDPSVEFRNPSVFGVGDFKLDSYSWTAKPDRSASLRPLLHIMEKEDQAGQRLADTKWKMGKLGLREDPYKAVPTPSHPAACPLSNTAVVGSHNLRRANKSDELTAYCPHCGSRVQIKWDGTNYISEAHSEY